MQPGFFFQSPQAPQPSISADYYPGTQGAFASSSTQQDNSTAFRLSNYEKYYVDKVMQRVSSATPEDHSDLMIFSVSENSVPPSCAQDEVGWHTFALTEVVKLVSLSDIL